MEVSSSSFCLFGKRPAPFLDEDIRRKLIAYGVDLTTITSVSHALKILRNIEKTVPDKETKIVKDEFNKTPKLSEKEIIAKINAMAQNLGINIDGDAPPAEKLAEISKKVKALKNNKKEEKFQLVGLETDIEQLNKALTKVTDKQDAVYSMLNVNANLNRYELGL